MTVYILPSRFTVMEKVSAITCCLIMEPGASFCLISELSILNIHYPVFRLHMSLVPPCTMSTIYTPYALTFNFELFWALVIAQYLMPKYGLPET
jgi:hypothetical protein